MVKRKKFIIEDKNGESFHTTVTIFEPDVTQNGEEFDYAEYLLFNYNNRELDIVKESANSKTAYGENHATVLENELSNIIIHNSAEKSTEKNSLSSIAPEIAPDVTLKITSEDEQNKGQTNSVGGIKYSVSNNNNNYKSNILQDSIVFYSEKQYNNLGCVRYNDVYTC